MGTIGVAGSGGYNPCLVTPVRESTWGKIKTQYNWSRRRGNVHGPGSLQVRAIE